MNSTLKKILAVPFLLVSLVVFIPITILHTVYRVLSDFPKIVSGVKRDTKSGLEENFDSTLLVWKEIFYELKVKLGM